MKNWLRAKKPIVAVVVTTVMLLFLISNYFHQKWVYEDYYAKSILFKERSVSSFLKLSHAYGDMKQYDLLRERLTDARERGYFDFFILQESGEAVWWGSPDGNKQLIDISYANFDQAVILPKVSYQTTRLGDKLDLTIGVFKSREDYVRNGLAESAKLMTEESIFVFLIVLLVTAWAMKDFITLARDLRRKGFRRQRSRFAVSAEAEILSRGLDSLGKSVSSISEKNRVLENQVLPSLKTELESGQSPPYDFDCTMVRTDINNFSTIYNTHNVDQLMETVQTFFTEVSHIVSRYDGLVHEFIGDEVIFYIKDREDISSTSLALGALREINRAASVIDAQTLNERSYRFTVKSSLAHGKVRFGRLVKGYSIAGAVLIETVRILTHVEEKNESTVHFAHRHLTKLNPYFVFEEAKAVRLKGYQDEVLLFKYLAHLPLANVWKEAIDNPSVLIGFQATEDLCEILDRLAHEKLTEAQRLGVIRILRSHQSTRFEVKIWKALIRMLTAHIDVDHVAIQNRALSATLMLTMNLVKANHEKEIQDILPVLQSCLTSLDGRVVANAVEVLHHFGIAPDEIAMGPLLAHPAVRVVANTMIYQSRDELKNETREKLKKMLNSRNVSQVASSAFAIGELARIYRSNDAVLAETNLELSSLFDLLPAAFSNNDDAMPRRQILFAARKYGQLELIEDLERRARRIGFPIDASQKPAA